MSDTLIPTLCTLAFSSLLIWFGFYTTNALTLGAFYTWYTYFRTKRISAPEDFHVIIIGAGASGVCMGKKLNDAGIKYTILEKANGIGGTWYENTYPGCGCDVRSHLYSYSFFQNPNWSRSFSLQEEILTYLETAAQRFGVYPHVHFGQKVIGCSWSQQNHAWTVEVEGGKKFVGNVLISSAGALHVPKWPEIQGRDNFQGESFHTAKWNKEFKAGGKRVAIIGTGASAVQTVPELHKMGVESLTVFQRTPAWAPPKQDFVFPSWVKVLFSWVPLANRLYRYRIFWEHELRFRILFTREKWITQRLASYVHGLVKRYINYAVKDPELREKLTPDYHMGCKRITPSDTYLKTFNKENVKLVTEKIAKITESGIETEDGKQYEFDTIVYATGFDLKKSSNPFEVEGLDPTTKRMFPEDYPRAHLGITHPNQPNLFLTLGPNTGLGHNSIIFMLECQLNYALDAMDKMFKSGAKSMVVRREALDQFEAWVKENFKGKVFADNSGCFAWYRDDLGRNWVLWPLDVVSFWWKTLSCDISQFKLQY